MDEAAWNILRLSKYNFNIIYLVLQVIIAFEMRLSHVMTFKYAASSESINMKLYCCIAILFYSYMIQQLMYDSQQYNNITMIYV